MWMEKVGENKFKYIERYIDPLTEKREKFLLHLLVNHGRRGIKLP
ncbi:hypothetical protein GQR36_20180 [Enterococcus termitis]